MATAPPARHTKSALCAPITCTRLHRSRPSASRVDCSTVIVRISSSANPCSSSRSANSASPSSTGGLRGWPKSVDNRLLMGSVARMPSATCSHVHLPVYGVVKQRSSSAPRCASATWSSMRERLRRELRMGDHDVPDPGGAGDVHHHEDLVARQVPGRQHELVLGDHLDNAQQLRQRRAVVVDDRDRRAAPCPASRSSFWIATHIGTATPAPYSRSRAPASLTASTVGSHTIRAPSRAAISTASGLSPPTARFSDSAPTARTPSGAVRLTVRARSAVDV